MFFALIMAVFSFLLVIPFGATANASNQISNSRLLLMKDGGKLSYVVYNNSDNEANDPAIQTLREFIVGAGDWQNRMTQYDSYYDAVDAVLPYINSGSCHWIREWVSVETDFLLPEEKSDSEHAEFGSIFILHGERWQGMRIN